MRFHFAHRRCQIKQTASVCLSLRVYVCVSVCVTVCVKKWNKASTASRHFAGTRCVWIIYLMNLYEYEYPNTHVRMRMWMWMRLRISTTLYVWVSLAALPPLLLLLLLQTCYKVLLFLFPVLCCSFVSGDLLPSSVYVAIVLFSFFFLCFCSVFRFSDSRNCEYPCKRGLINKLVKFVWVILSWYEYILILFEFSVPFIY